MNTGLKTLARVSAVFAFVICFDHDGDAVETGIGLYFIGKAFFVGPMLLVAAERLGNGSDDK